VSEVVANMIKRRIEGGIVITAENRHIIKEGSRYKVYLPIEHNDTWEDLRKLGKTVTVIIVIK
jgi:shikimate kinase